MGHRAAVVITAILAHYVGGLGQTRVLNAERNWIMKALECYRCGGITIGGRCMDCDPVLPMPSDWRLANPEFGLVRWARNSDVRPIEPLRDVSELASFQSRSSIRAVGDIATRLGFISSQTQMGMTWMETRGERTRLYVGQRVSVRGLIFERSASAELIIRES